VRSSLALVIVGCLVLTSCGERAPKRDQVEIIKGQFSRLQSALKDRNRVVLDSLSSRDMVDDGLTVDSLLRFVGGTESPHAFDHFGRYEFVYNSKKARVDCPLVDSTGHEYGAVTLTFARSGDTWLLKRFETAQPPIDSQ
jgi:hypothetical protein